MQFYLRELAHARAGDKGDTSNIGVIAYDPSFYPVILRSITVDRVRKHFGSLVRGEVTRYEMPNINAINIVMEKALGGGVTRSLSLDPHGKSYSTLILSMIVEVDPETASKLLKLGRKPVE